MSSPNYQNLSRDMCCYFHLDYRVANYVTVRASTSFAGITAHAQILGPVQLPVTDWVACESELTRLYHDLERTLTGVTT